MSEELTVAIACRVSQKTYDDIARVAKIRNEPFSDTLREIIDWGLTFLDKEDTDG